MLEVFLRYVTLIDCFYGKVATYLDGGVIFTLGGDLKICIFKKDALLVHLSLCIHWPRIDF